MTTQEITKPGWYWVSLSHDHATDLAEIGMPHGRATACVVFPSLPDMFNTLDTIGDSFPDALWQGPLEPPKLR